MMLLDKFKLTTKSYDLVVVGGGMTGICAAIEAARHNLKIALIQDRPVLGGNASSEIRVWMVGAIGMGRNRYAAEAGIIGEIDLENLFRNQDGNPQIWDQILLEFVHREKNIDLFLNTVALDVDVDNEAYVTCIKAYQMSSETWFQLDAKFFIDATGNASIAMLGGNPYRHGMEARKEFEEPSAPLEANFHTLGSSILFYTKVNEKPVQFHPFEEAFSIEKIEDIVRQPGREIYLRYTGCDFWWIEDGGTKDTLKDSEIISRDLNKLIFGIWNYIKNSGKFEADHLQLEWVGRIPGKRETRRIQGLYVLTENDILEKRKFPDAIATGGWPIDTHPPAGIFDKNEPTQQIDVGVYQIPLRACLASTLKNLLVAGRAFSATHLAFASTRVMKTCASLGQAVGATAAICVANKLRDLHKIPDNPELIIKIQKLLQSENHWIFGLKDTLIEDSKISKLSVSSILKFEQLKYNELHPLNKAITLMFPSFKETKSISLLLKSKSESELKIKLWQGKQRDACVNRRDLGSTILKLKKNLTWMKIDLPPSIQESQDLYLELPKADAEIAVTTHPWPGVTASVGDRCSMTLIHPCFKMDPSPRLSGNFLLKPLTRPETQPEYWAASLIEEEPWIEVKLQTDDNPGKRLLTLFFDLDFNRDYNQFRPTYYDYRSRKMPPNLVKSFSIYTSIKENGYKLLETIFDHHNHIFQVKLPQGHTCVKIIFHETWGADKVIVYRLHVENVEARRIECF